MKTYLLGVAVLLASATGVGLFYDTFQSGRPTAASETSSMPHPLVVRDARDGDRLGAAVALDGDTVLVGAQLGRSAGPVTGEAYLFQNPPGGSLGKLGGEDAKSFLLDETNLAGEVITQVASGAVHNLLSKTRRLAVAVPGPPCRQGNCGGISRIYSSKISVSQKHASIPRPRGTRTTVHATSPVTSDPIGPRT